MRSRRGTVEVFDQGKASKSLGRAPRVGVPRRPMSIAVTTEMRWVAGKTRADVNRLCDKLVAAASHVDGLVMYHFRHDDVSRTSLCTQVYLDANAFKTVSTRLSPLLNEVMSTFTDMRESVSGAKHEVDLMSGLSAWLADAKSYTFDGGGVSFYSRGGGKHEASMGAARVKVPGHVEAQLTRHDEAVPVLTAVDHQGAPQVRRNATQTRREATEDEVARGLEREMQALQALLGESRAGRTQTSSLASPGRVQTSSGPPPPPPPVQTSSSPPSPLRVHTSGGPPPAVRSPVRSKLSPGAAQALAHAQARLSSGLSPRRLPDSG